MRIDTEKIKAFFKRTGKVQDVDWSQNVFVPIKETVQPDVRLNFNDTFENIHKQLKSK